MAQNGSVSGQVLDGNQEALPGVTVNLKGTNIGTSTGLDGKFIINQVSLGPQTLTFSFIGYEDQERSITIGQLTWAEQKVIWFRMVVILRSQKQEVIPLQ